MDFHRSAFRKAKAAMEEAQRHLEAEERVKQQLGLELNMLVQESSTAQLKARWAAAACRRLPSRNG